MGEWYEEGRDSWAREIEDLWGQKAVSNLEHVQPNRAVRNFKNLQRENTFKLIQKSTPSFMATLL